MPSSIARGFTYAIISRCQHHDGILVTGRGAQSIDVPRTCVNKEWNVLYPYMNIRH